MIDGPRLLPRRRSEPAIRPWPYRPAPLPDELLTSYLCRLATGLDLKPITFLNTVFGSARNLLAQDLDNFAPDRVVDRIATGVERPPDDLRACTLAAYAGLLLTRHNPGGRNAWLLPVTIDNNRRHRAGLQFCPSCLTSDNAPYFRRRWRLAFVTHCSIHGSPLRDRCAACAAPVHQHTASSPRHCHQCGESLCQATGEPGLNGQVAWQADLEAALERGWMQLGGDAVYAHVAFSVARQVAALLVNGPRAAALRDATARAWGGDPSPFPKPTRRQPFEYLEIDERLRLFDLVRRLMEGWPFRFVHACAEAALHGSQAIRDMPNPPYAYEKIVRAYMDRTPYKANEAEVAAAAAWLRRTNGHASYRVLKAICGESRDAIYKHMDYEREQSRPSPRRAAAMSGSNA